MWYSYGNYYFSIIIAIIFIELNILGYLKNKAKYPRTSLIIFVSILIIHFIKKDILSDSYVYNAIIDMICIGISLIDLLIVDEIETRRKLIKEVFQSRYKD